MDKGRVATCAERLSAALFIRGMKQSELSEKTKIPKACVSQYVSGVFAPKQDRIYILARALNVSEAWLMGYDVPMEREKKNSPDENNLTEGEQLLLDLFRKIPNDKQELVIQMIRVALGSPE